jgi:hypothetical protein
MRHYSDEWILEWCGENGWTDLFTERLNHYWAFPPGAVIPEPIPPQTLKTIKAEKGLCWEERRWLIWATVATIAAVGLSYALKSPMPLVLAFAFDAIATAKLEVEFPYE